MPNGVRQNLNQLARATPTVAEINGANRPFAAVTLNNIGAHDINIDGLIYSIFCADPTDYARIAAGIINIQRGLAVTLDSVFPAAENLDEIMVYYLFREPFARFDMFVRPFVLPAGNVYSIVFNLLRGGAPFVGDALMALTAVGSPAGVRGAPKLRGIDERRRRV